MIYTVTHLSSENYVGGNEGEVWTPVKTDFNKIYPRSLNHGPMSPTWNSSFNSVKYTNNTPAKTPAAAVMQAGVSRRLRD